MSLITDTQRKAAKEPEPKAPELPKPQPQPEAPQNVEFTAPGVEPLPPGITPTDTNTPATQLTQADLDAKVGSSLTGYMDLQGGGQVSTSVPPAPAAVVPPLNLWKDAQVDLGFDNLFNQNLVQTQSPTLFAQPLNDTGAGVYGANSVFNQQAGRYVANEQQRAVAAKQQQAALQTTSRNTLRNTPDVEKAWHEQAWSGITGFASDFLFGTKEGQAAADQQKKFDPIYSGSYGVHGAGLGGAIKYALSVPIGLVNNLDKLREQNLILGQKAILDASNPVTEALDGTRGRWNDLSEEQKKESLLRRLNDSRAWIGAPVLNPARAFTSPIADLADTLTGQVPADDLNDANPNLPGIVLNASTRKPVTDKERAGRTDGELLRTGKFVRATAFAPKGNYYSRYRRPGQTWQEDPVGTAWELINQIGSPGNKIDVVGNAFGEVVGKVGGAAVRRVFGTAAERQMRSAAKLLPDDPAPTAAQRLAVRNNVFGTLPTSPPIAKPTTITAKPLANPTTTASKITVPAVLPGLTRQQTNVATQLQPTSTVIQPKLPGQLAEQVGIGVPGQRIEGLVKPVANDHDIYIEQLKRGTPQEQAFVSGYTGKSWLEWQAFAAKGGASAEQTSSIGVAGVAPKTVGDLTPSQRAAVGLGEEGADLPLSELPGKQRQRLEEVLASSQDSPRLRDEFSASQPPSQFVEELPGKQRLENLTAQNADLVANKSVLEASLEAIEKVFDTTVDLGRRSIDELPLRPLSADDVYRALDTGAKLRLPDSVVNLLPPATASALVTNDTDTIAKLVANGELNDATVNTVVQAVNTAIQPVPAVASVASEFVTAPPARVWHGTALSTWEPTYNVVEFGSRGELGSGLYTTVNKVEATDYAKATVGNNRSVEVAYDELAPQVVELSTEGFKSTLDASAAIGYKSQIVREVMESLPTDDAKARMRGFVLTSDDSLTFRRLMSAVEDVAAASDPTEAGLRAINKSVSDTLRKLGYDSISDPESGWFVALDNLKFKTVAKEPLQAVTEPLEAATARYNADSAAAAKFPDHLTTDANLRDSAYQVLDQARTEVDEVLEQVQEQAKALIREEPVEPVVKVVDEAPTPATIEKVVETLEAQAKEAEASGKPATAKAKRAKAVNEVAVAETKGEVPPNTSVLKARAEELTNRTLPKKVPLKKPIDEMTGTELRKLAKDMEVDISHFPNIRKTADRDALRSLLKRMWENPESAVVPLRRELQQALVNPDPAKAVSGGVSKPAFDDADVLRQFDERALAREKAGFTGEPSNLTKVEEVVPSVAVPGQRVQTTSAKVRVKQRKVKALEVELKSDPENPQLLKELEQAKAELLETQALVEVPVNPHNSLKEALEDQASDICNF